MNSKNLFHAFVLLALLVGQMSTQAHMIDHVHSSAANCLENTHEHSSHSHDHRHINDIGSILTAKHNCSDEIKSDCSLFHAYAGVTALTPILYETIVVSLSEIAIPHYVHPRLVKRNALATAIRGPPYHA